MTEFGKETTTTSEITGVFGGISFDTNKQPMETIETSGTFKSPEVIVQENAGTIRDTSLTKYGFWQKFKSFWLQEIDWNKEIKVVLTPKQQKIEDEINEFLHQEITWEKVHDFLFQEVTFGKKK